MRVVAAPTAKHSPVQMWRVCGYSSLYIAVPAIPLRLWREPIAANSLPILLRRKLLKKWCTRKDYCVMHVGKIPILVFSKLAAVFVNDGLYFRNRSIELLQR